MFPFQLRLVLSYQAHLPAFLHSMFHVGVYHAVALVSFSELPRAPQSLETRRSARYLRSSPGGFLQMGIAPRAVPSMRKWTILIAPLPCSAGILPALLNLLTPSPNFAAIRLLQTNFSACY